MNVCKRLDWRLLGQEEALVDLLTEHEAANQEKRLQPSIIAQQLDLLLPEKGETYGSPTHRYKLT